MARKRTLSLCLILAGALPSIAQNPAYPQITVSVRSSIPISETQLIDAEKPASRVFEKAGIVVRWINCAKGNPDRCRLLACSEAPGPAALSIQLLPHSLNISDDAFGVSFLDAAGGVYADIFLDHVQHLHDLDPRISFSRLLGTVIAHEIGHLLLGQHSHTARGLMQPRWEREQLESIGKGNLLFDSQQSAKLQARARVLGDREIAIASSAEHERGGSY